MGRPRKKKPLYVLGFVFTPEELEREEAVKRSAVDFFKTYGQGAKPRMNGEYYTPGTSPEDLERTKIWVSRDTAVRMMGGINRLRHYATKGKVERRKMLSNYRVYEYVYQDIVKVLSEITIVR